MANSNAQVEQEIVFHENKPKKKLWLWGCGGGMALVCVVLGIVLVLFFYLSNQSYPLDGEVSIPPMVKQGDMFDFVITLTNSTTEPIFIKHIVLSDYLGAPTILNGARIVSIEPEMFFEVYDTNSFQYSYFREIKPGETQTVTFHMQADSSGIFYEDVSVYAKDPLLSDPAFKIAYQSDSVEIEIAP
jgi:hypothetical protein